MLFKKLIFAILPLLFHGGYTASDINEKYLNMVFQNINTTVDPCENFYQYACGNWVSHYVSDNYLDMPGYMEDLVNEQLLKVLIENKNKTGIYKKLWNYYQSCQELSSPALNYYLKLIQEKLQFQWPIFREKWNETWINETNFDWLSTIAHLRLYGLNGVFLTQNINVRLANGSHYILEVHQHQSHSQLLLDNITNIFINFGMSEEYGKFISKKIIKLEERMINLTNIEFILETEDDDLRYKNSFKEFTIDEMIKAVPNIDWKKYFSIILNRNLNIKSDVVQTFAFNTKYFEQLSQVLKDSSNETICYYIMLKLMYNLNENLPTSSNRTMFCVKHLRGYMPLAMNFLYEEHYYKAKRNKTDAALMTLFNKIRKAFENIVDENFLGLNSNEQSFILDELRTMQLKIGNIPVDINRNFVDEFYSEIKTNASNFYENNLQLLKLNTRREQKRLQNIPTPPNMKFYEHDAETASASSPVKIFDNAILVPYGFLQLPLFDSELNPILQFSLFGFIIAHEIIHAYDLFHIVYDQYGNYNDIGVSVAHHFWKYMDCFDRHPSDNLSENIADIAGLRLVYKAFFDDVANSLNHENNLPFVQGNFTNEQLFFINSVQFLCANMEKISSLHTKTLNLEHDMHDVRVQRNWANYEQFGLAFHCANNTTMNPSVKCRLW